MMKPLLRCMYVSNNVTLSFSSLTYKLSIYFNYKYRNKITTSNTYLYKLKYRIYRINIDINLCR